jgi:predicted ATPase
MVFLRRLSLHGYKSIAELQDFALQPLNVLIGTNGAGKSNPLSFFDLLRAIAAGQLATAVASQGGASVLLHQGAKRTPTLSFEAGWSWCSSCR